MAKWQLYTTRNREAWNQLQKGARFSARFPGDAAHPMTPNMGQGACQGIEDGVTLVACLTTEPTVASALQAYEAQRLKRANAVVQRSARIGQVFQWERPLAVKVRNTVIKKLPSQLLLKQLEWVLKEA